MIVRRGLCVVFVSLTFSSGCATVPKMTLSYQAPDQPGRTTWWVMRDPCNVRPPIVGVEQRLEGGLTRQIVFTDRGMRLFSYRDSRLVRSSLPLAGPEGEPDPTTLRAGMGLCALRNASSAQPLPDIPTDEIHSIALAEDIAALLQRHWTAARVQPTLNLTFRDINDELEHCHHGLTELLEASSAF